MISPFTRVNSINVQFADPAVKKRTSYFFKKALVQTDIGWLFSDIQTKTDFMFSSKEFDFQIRTNENQPISQYLFYSSKDKVVVSRRYQTISEFLGGFAGVCSFCYDFLRGFDQLIFAHQYFENHYK